MGRTSSASPSRCRRPSGGRRLLVAVVLVLVIVLVRRAKKDRRQRASVPLGATARGASPATDDHIEVAIEAPLADTLDQQRSTTLAEEDATPSEMPLEIPEADLLDQVRVVPFDDDQRDDGPEW